MANIMWNTKATYPFSGITMVLLCGLLLHSCQYHLQVYGDGEATPTEGAPNQEGANTLGISTETARASRKRPAEERLQDIEEKKDSPTSLGHSSFGTTSTTMSTQNVTARITQESQESTAMTLASGQATTAPAKKALQDVAVTQEGAKTVCKKDDNTADQEQKIPADLSRWFKEFAEAVDDEDVRYLGNISEAIPRLVQEGKKKGRLGLHNKKTTKTAKQQEQACSTCQIAWVIWLGSNIASLVSCSELASCSVSVD